MNNYVPFLKLKSNEIMAVKELEDNLRQNITPFFDFPHNKKYTEDSFKRSVGARICQISKHLGDIPYFYLDNFDVVSDLKINNLNNYDYLLRASKELPVVPVVSIDRNEEHVNAVCKAVDSGLLKSNIIALRFTTEDLESFDAIKDDIENKLGTTIGKFKEIHLILDCRFCLNENAKSLALQIHNFIKGFTEIYLVNKIIVAGSSIPCSIKEIIAVNQDIKLPRTELDIFKELKKLTNGKFDVSLGDYGIVSPDYSDIDIIPEAMLNVTTAKIIYTFDRHHYLIRGGAIRTHKKGFGQYNDFAKIIIEKSFYRGAGYSFGDNYIEEKSRSIGSTVMPSTIIKPTVNLHMTYMLNDYIPTLA